LQPTLREASYTLNPLPSWERDFNPAPLNPAETLCDRPFWGKGLGDVDAQRLPLGWADLQNWDALNLNLRLD